MPRKVKAGPKKTLTAERAKTKPAPRLEHRRINPNEWMGPKFRRIYNASQVDNMPVDFVNPARIRKEVGTTDQWPPSGLAFADQILLNNFSPGIRPREVLAHELGHAYATQNLPTFPGATAYGTNYDSYRKIRGFDPSVPTTTVAEDYAETFAKYMQDALYRGGKFQESRRFRQYPYEKTDEAYYQPPYGRAPYAFRSEAGPLQETQMWNAVLLGQLPKTRSTRKPIGV